MDIQNRCRFYLSSVRHHDGSTYRKGWDDETVDIAALVMHTLFVLRRKKSVGAGAGRAVYVFVESGGQCLGIVEERQGDC